MNVLDTNVLSENLLPDGQRKADLLATVGNIFGQESGISAIAVLNG